jgi:cell division protein FtsW
MSAPASTVRNYARSSGQPRRLVLDPWLVGTVAALLLIGLIMVASASIGISEKETGHAFHYFQRQLLYVLAGLVAAGVGLAVPTRI